MGLFSGKNKTTVKAVAQRMLSDDGFKYGNQQAMAKWLWETSGQSHLLNKPNLSEYLLEASKSGLPKNFDRLYRYAKNPAKYVFGLPTSYLSNTMVSDITDSVVIYIRQQGVRERDIYSVWFSDKDFYMTVWKTLVDTYGYNSKTNELESLSRQENNPCYLSDGYLMVKTDNNFKNQALPFNWGEIPDLRDIDTSRTQTNHQVGTEDCFIMSYVVVDGTTHTEKTIKIDLAYLNRPLALGSVIDEEPDYVYAVYKDRDGKYVFFEYAFGSGGITDIDTAITVGNTFGEYYPRIYFRVNRQDIVESSDTTKKKHLKKALKFINQDAVALTNEIKTGIGENYDDVHGLFIFMGVRINEAKDDSALAEYCFRYFKQLYDLHQDDFTAQIISDNVSKQVISTTTMTFNRQSGKKVDVGNYTVIGGKEPITEKTKSWYQPWNTDAYYHDVIHQVNENEYDVLRIYELTVINDISGFSFANRADDADLVVPIDRSIVNKLSHKEKELLLHKSLHLQIMFAKVVKQKWYETSAFRFVVALVGVALSVVFAPAGAGVLATLKATAISAIKAMTVAYAVNALLNLAVKAGIIDIKTATILSFIVSIAVSAYAMNFDMSKILTAPNIMRTINGAFDAYNKMMTIEIQDLHKQMNDFGLFVKDREAQLAKAQKLLDTKVFDIDMELLKSSYIPSVDLFESVEMFYSRHNSFNVVGLSHGLIDDFVDGTLRLSKPRLLTVNETDDLLLLV